MERNDHTLRQTHIVIVQQQIRHILQLVHLFLGKTGSQKQNHAAELKFDLIQMQHMP